MWVQQDTGYCKLLILVIHHCVIDRTKFDYLTRLLTASSPVQNDQAQPEPSPGFTAYLSDNDLQGH